MPADDAYSVEVNRDRKAERSRRVHATLADIGEIPAVVNRERREACRQNLQLFLETYFPESTGLTPFSDDHKRVIARGQQCIVEGGRFAQAVYRGFAKTTIAENSALWAMLYGYRKFSVLFGAEAGVAKNSIEAIKMELSGNELLHEDFPEAIHAIRELEGKPQRCNSQHYGGTPTHIEWTADLVVLPTIKLTPAEAARIGIEVEPNGTTKSSGAVLMVKGMTAATRGLKWKRPDGTQQRPDLVFIDDPQTDESAGSPMQVEGRLDLIRRSILRLGGHRNSIATFALGTVIEHNDLMDQLLDPTRNPSWQSERIPMVRAWSSAHKTLWDEYRRLRNGYDPLVVGDQSRAHAAATAFYVANREAMDDGCVVSWDSCYTPETEVSAIQHAYNLLIDDGEATFASECQQSPMSGKDRGEDPNRSIDGSDVVRRLSNRAKRLAPVWCHKFTGFVDVQGECLFWMLAGFGDGFSGCVLDYGIWPDQGRRDFYKANLRNTLERQFPKSGQESRWKQGIDAIIGQLCGPRIKREDGSEHGVSLCLVDSGHGLSTETVFESLRASPHKSILRPSRGVGIGARNKPMSEHHLPPGGVRGPGWTSYVPHGRAFPAVNFDANYWKSFVAARLATPPGDPGSLIFYGHDPDEHRALAVHLGSEYRVRTSGNGRELDEWMEKPGRIDNDLWDCLVGCHVAAGVLGLSVGGSVSAGRPGGGARSPRKRRFSYMEI